MLIYDQGVRFPQSFLVVTAVSCAAESCRGVEVAGGYPRRRNIHPGAVQQKLVPELSYGGGRRGMGFTLHSEPLL